MKDKEWAAKIKEITGCTHAQAMEVVGLIADSNQEIYKEGYGKGYDNGAKDKEMLDYLEKE